MPWSAYRVVSAFRHAGRLIEKGADCPPLSDAAAAKLLRAGCIAPPKGQNGDDEKQIVQPPAAAPAPSAPAGAPATLAPAGGGQPTASPDEAAPAARRGRGRGRGGD